MVVGRKLANASRLLGFRVLLRVGSADEPEDRWRLPGSTEDSEVLARRGRLGFADSITAEVRPEGVDNSLCRVWIVGHQRVAAQRDDLWRSRSARRRGFSVHNPRNRREYARPYIFIERAHVQLDDRLVRNDVLLVPGLQ